MLKKIVIGLFIILLLLSVTGYFLLQNKKPQRQGELQLIGLTNPVDVNYDEFGIPHIYATNDADLYKALGYVHAQDRLFQMELLRRLANGRMAEIFGKELIGVDKLYRTLGLAPHARKWIKNMRETADPKLLQVFENYLFGVNAFLETGVKPLEFNILSIPAEKFTIEDIAAIMGFTSFSFAQALHDDPLLHLLAQKLDANYLDDLGILYTEGFPQLPVNSQLLETMALNTATVIGQLKPANLFHGSNSWLLSPSKSESGKALFVNDPHIAYGQPSVWYEAQLESDNTQIYGHFMGLIPLPLLGFNEDLAWGLTMFENDDMDLYLEKVNPENPNQYWAVDHWQEYQQREEVIKVKDEDDLLFTIKATRHGPIVNQMLSGVAGEKNSLASIEQPLAMWWSFLDPNNKQMEAFYELPFADSVSKAAAAAAKIHSPGLNLMYANAKGDIAWWATAKLPIRPPHVNSKFILDGASGKDDILGYYDFSHNPKNINPESGFIYTANNQPADMGDGLIPGYYSPKDRPTRITHYLTEKDKFSVKDMQSMLLDNTTPTAKLFQQIAIPVLEKRKAEFSTIENAALALFTSWKGNHDPDEVGATVYTRFRLRLMQLAMVDEIGEELFRSFQNGFLMDRTTWRLLPNAASPWWDNSHTEQLETREDLIVQAWKDSTNFLIKRLGSDIGQWQWQQDVQMVHEHPLGKVEPFDKLFNVGPLPSSGGVEAVNNIMFISNGDDLNIMMGPSTRRIIDFGDITNSWGINPTGQSGVPFDRHYDDQAMLYARGEYRAQYISKEDVKNNSKEKLILIP